MKKDEEISKEIILNRDGGLVNWALAHLEDLQILAVGLKQRKIIWPL